MLALIFVLGVASAQQQYFRVQPHDVRVHEGGEITLECEVANLGGQVQWTKDGFALGKCKLSENSSKDIMEVTV